MRIYTSLKKLEEYRESAIQTRKLLEEQVYAVSATLLQVEKDIIRSKFGVHIGDRVKMKWSDGDVGEYIIDDFTSEYHDDSSTLVMLRGVTSRGVPAKKRVGVGFKQFMQHCFVLPDV